MVGNDLRVMTPEIVEILTNPGAVAVNQDKMGVPGWRFGIVPDKYEIWIRPLSDGAWAVCALNDSDDTQSIELDWERLARHMKGDFEVQDIWTNEDLGRNDHPFAKEVASHDVWFLKLTPIAE
jgi:alpha-galactosidase